MASEHKFMGISLKTLPLWVLGLGFVLPFGLIYLSEQVPALHDAVMHLGRLMDRGILALETDPVTALLGGIALVLLAPGFLLIFFVWNILFGQSTNPFAPLTAWSTILVIGVMIFSWIFWRTAWSRTFFLLGRWDPFPVTGNETRRWFLKGFVKLREGFEIATKFGRRPTSAWAGFVEVLSNRWYPGDVFLGRPKLPLGTAMLRPIGLKTDKHMVTIAGTGAGKSTAALIPNLCIHEGSLFCIDPKGELARITARRRGSGGNGVYGMGQAVHVLDPFNVSGLGSRSSYNVFDEMAAVAAYDMDRPVSYAHRIAEALVKPTSKNDPYWDDAAKSFLKGLILYVFFHEPEEMRTLPRLRELVSQGDVLRYEEAVKEGKIKAEDKDYITPFDVLFEKMKEAGKGPHGNIIAGVVRSLEIMGERQRGGVISMAQQHTAFLDTPEIARACARSDFLLQDLMAGWTSVYLCIPANMVAGPEGSWLRMFVLLLIDMIMRTQKVPQPPVLLAIDEFPSLGKLDGIELVAPLLRSYGARFWAIGQDIEQFKRVYPDSWGGFLGGAEAVQFMGVKHLETVDMLVKLLGRHVVTEMEMDGNQRRRYRTEKPLLDADQVRRILSPNRKNEIIWRGDQRPMLLKTAPYFAYMPSWYYDRDERFKEKLRRRIWRPWFGKPPALFPQMDVPPPEPPVPPGPPPPPYPPEPVFEQDSKRPVETDQGPVQKEDPITPLNPKVPPSLQMMLNNKLWDGAQPWSSYLADLRTEMDAPRPQSSEEEDSEESQAIEELHSMIGLGRVKEEVQKLVDLTKLKKLRKKFDMKELQLTHHLVFTGNPGTGKTTVARIVGGVYKDLGVLKSGHVVEVDRAHLVAGFIGQTALKVQEAVKSALDGVLFVDEAYALVTDTSSGRDFGAEAVAALLKAMEDNRERLVVIVAGYSREMEKFIESNPGLKSRFKTVIPFDDYEAEELAEIFEKMCSDAGCRLSFEATTALRDRVKELKERAGREFGNGRDVRNMFEDCLARQARRLGAREDVSKSDISMIEVEDLPGVEGAAPLIKVPILPAGIGDLNTFSLTQRFLSDFPTITGLMGMQQKTMLSGKAKDERTGAGEKEVPAPETDRRPFGGLTLEERRECETVWRKIGQPPPEGWVSTGFDEDFPLGELGQAVVNAHRRQAKQTKSGKTSKGGTTRKRPKGGGACG